MTRFNYDNDDLREQFRKDKQRFISLLRISYHNIKDYNKPEATVSFNNQTHKLCTNDTAFLRHALLNWDAVHRAISDYSKSNGWNFNYQAKVYNGVKDAANDLVMKTVSDWLSDINNSLIEREQKMRDEHFNARCKAGQTASVKSRKLNTLIRLLEQDKYEEAKAYALRIKD